MVKSEKYSQLLSQGLLLDHFFILKALEKGESLPDHRRVRGFLNVLELRGFIVGRKLTWKGKELIKEEPVHVPLLAPNRQAMAPVSAEEEKGESFNQWIIGLHTRLQAHLKSLTGRVQVKAKNDAGKEKWDFMCGKYDLHKNLERVMKQYELSDREKIEKILLRHITDCHSSGEWKPLLQYYIWKLNVGSRLASAYESFEETEEDNSISDNFVNI